MRHELRRTTLIPASIDAVFAFFADAANLQRITPPELFFRIITPLPVAMATGSLIDYRLRLFGIPFPWRTLITEWSPPLAFCDEQLQGPYRFWRHQHHFRELDGSTEMRDLVEYSLPCWPLGELAGPLVAGQLERIFDYRETAIREIFRKPESFSLRIPSR